MVAIHLTVARPLHGKRELGLGRMRQRAELMGKHGFTVRLANGFSGPSQGCVALMAYVENWTAMGKAITALHADSDYTALVTEREADPYGEIIRRVGMRTIFGEPRWADHPISYMRRYHMPRSNMKLALDILQEIDDMNVDGMAVGAAVPLTGDNMNMMTVAYQFKSFEVMGKTIDEIGLSEKFQSLVDRASTIGELRTADVFVTI